MTLSSIDWQSVLLNIPNALQFWSAVKSTIYDAIEMAVPKQTTTAYHSLKRCITIHEQSESLMSKRYLWRHIRSDKNNLILHVEYKKYTNEWRDLLRNYKKQSEEKVKLQILVFSIIMYASKQLIGVASVRY